MLPPDIRRWVEETVLPAIQARYEELGYDFVIAPRRDQLHGLGSDLRPDAIATRGEDRVAIEVRRRGADPKRLFELYDRFAKEPGWRLVVVYGDEPVPEPIPTADVARLREAAERIDRLVENGDPSAALVMAFALLEATERVLVERLDKRAKRPTSVIQSLAMAGLLDRKTEQSLFDLSKTRNAVVHGDLGTLVEAKDARLVLAAVDRAIAIAFAG